MRFDPTAYGDEVAAVLALEGNGIRPMPLTFDSSCPKDLSHRLADQMFSGARSPRGALSGLWLYFSCFEESHRISQDLHTAEGSFWHGIAHRREPDAGNSAYWFRRVGSHAIFPGLRDAAAKIADQNAIGAFKVGTKWDPLAFIDFCELARTQPGSAVERVAMEIQLAEWQLLFDYCARPTQ